jgi:hypothetical protein
VTRPTIALLLLGLGGGCATAGPLEMATKAPDFSIDDGDYILPRVSPDGRALAYAEVTVFEGADFRMESTRLWLLDLTTRERTLLLDEGSALPYGHYAASAIDLDWASANEVSLHLHDGDVGVSTLVFDVRTRELTSESHFPGGPMSAEAEEMARRVRDEFPDRAGEVYSWFMGPTAIYDDRAIFRVPEGADHPSGTWVADLRNHELKLLLSHGDSLRFAGGAPLGEGEFLLAMYSGGDLAFLVYERGLVREIASVEVEAGRVEVLRVWNDGVLLRVVQARRWEEGDNPLFWYDGRRVRGLVGPDATIHADYWTGSGSPSVLVFNVWSDGQRHIEVRRH